MTCPEGRRCSWCGPIARVERDAERDQLEEREADAELEALIEDGLDTLEAIARQQRTREPRS